MSVEKKNNKYEEWKALRELPELKNQKSCPGRKPCVWS